VTRDQEQDGRGHEVVVVHALAVVPGREPGEQVVLRRLALLLDQSPQVVGDRRERFLGPAGVLAVRTPVRFEGGGELRRPSLEPGLVLARDAEQLANHCNRQGVGEIVHQIEVGPVPQPVEKGVGELLRLAVHCPHAGRCELAHDLPAQEIVIRRIAEDEGTMARGDPASDRADEQVAQGMPGPAEQRRIGQILRADARIVQEAVEFRVGAHDVTAVVLAAHGRPAHLGVERVRVGAVGRIEDLLEQRAVHGELLSDGGAGCG
jgi:hypothetical protein